MSKTNNFPCFWGIFGSPVGFNFRFVVASLPPKRFERMVAITVVSDFYLEDETGHRPLPPPTAGWDCQPLHSVPGRIFRFYICNMCGCQISWSLNGCRGVRLSHFLRMEGLAVFFFSSNKKPKTLLATHPGHQKNSPNIPNLKSRIICFRCSCWLVVPWLAAC